MLVRTNDDVCIVTNYIGTIIGGSSTVSLNGIQPVGTIGTFAGTSEDVPETWSLCNGESLSLTSYPSLYNRLGKRYGYHVKITDAGISGDIQVGNRVRQSNNISGIITSVSTGSMEVDVDYLSANADGSYTQHDNSFDFTLGNPLTIDNTTTGKVGSITEFRERSDDQEDITLNDYTSSVIRFRKPDLRGKFVLGAADTGSATAIDVPSPGFKLGQLGGDYEGDSSNGNVGTVEALSGSNSVDTVPPYQSLNWIIKTTANAPAALIDNLTAQINLNELTDVSAPSDAAQSGDIIMFDSTNTDGAKYYPYRLFDAFPTNNKVFNVSNAAGDASIRFGNTSTNQAFRIDLEGLQPNGTNRQFRVTNGVNILQAQKSNLNHGVVGVGVTPQNDDAANLVVGSKGLRFNAGSSPTITRVRTTVRSTGDDNSLVTEQGIREALTNLPGFKLSDIVSHQRIEGQTNVDMILGRLYLIEKRAVCGDGSACPQPRTVMNVDGGRAISFITVETGDGGGAAYSALINSASGHFSSNFTIPASGVFYPSGSNTGQGSRTTGIVGWCLRVE